MATPAPRSLAATPGAEPAAAVDGRAARSARTRDAIAEAVLGLLGEGRLEPTSLEIATRAGIAERTLFHHFAGLEELFGEVAARQAVRIAERFPAVSTGGDLDSRIAALVAQRAELHEFITPVRRAALRLESRSAAVAKRLTWGRRELAREVSRLFAAEIESAPAARRPRLRAALALCTSWSAWEQLRRHQGLEPGAARAAVQTTLTALLRPVPSPGATRRRAAPAARRRSG